MGLLDRFKPKPHPLVTWLEQRGGTAHGRKLTFNDIKYDNGMRELHVYLEGRQAQPDRIQFQRPETYLTPEQAKALPSVHDPQWRAAMEAEDLPRGFHVGGGFVLDPDFNLESPLVIRHITRVGGYMERFSPAIERVVYEPPHLRIDVRREAGTPTELKRDIERAHELLSLLEEG
jgi:hypothetical protein